VRIAIFGAGYLGTTDAVCMATLGHEVLGVDVDQARVSALEIRELPFYEPHPAELLRQAIGSGRLKFTLRGRRANSGGSHASGLASDGVR
jgi:UDPglucose 6-dehydrogenase